MKPKEFIDKKIEVEDAEATASYGGNKPTCNLPENIVILGPDMQAKEIAAKSLAELLGKTFTKVGRGEGPAYRLAPEYLEGASGYVMAVDEDICGDAEIMTPTTARARVFFIKTEAASLAAFDDEIPALEERLSSLETACGAAAEKVLDGDQAPAMLVSKMVAYLRTCGA